MAHNLQRDSHFSRINISKWTTLYYMSTLPETFIVYKILPWNIISQLSENYIITTKILTSWALPSDLLTYRLQTPKQVVAELTKHESRIQALTRITHIKQFQPDKWLSCKSGNTSWYDTIPWMSENWRLRPWHQTPAGHPQQPTRCEHVNRREQPARTKRPGQKHHETDIALSLTQTISTIQHLASWPSTPPLRLKLYFVHWIIKSSFIHVRPWHHLILMRN